jgi:hypothetical protein
VVRQRAVPLLAGGLVLVAWCGWVSGFHRSTRAAEVTWVVSVVMVVAVALLFRLGRRGSGLGWPLAAVADPWPRPGRGGARRALIGVAPWLVVIVVTAAWEVLGIDTGPHAAHLTISALSQAFRPLNALLLLVWMLVGIGYAAARARASVAARVPSPGRDAEAFRALPGVAWGAGTAPVRSHSLAPALLLPSSRPLGVVFWLALLAAVVVVDVGARRSAGRFATAGEFVRFISTSPVANVVLIAAWAFAGYHLFAR